ncbi:MAG: septum formation initiator family protein [Planctomycetes bacterium]|nr:septum formation initiator family protein [Planctomycetota bacterium]
MLQRFLITFCILVTIVIVFSAIVTQKREKRRNLESELKTLSDKVASAKKKNSKLKQEAEAVVGNPIQIERIAREDFGFTRQGEILYKKYKFELSEPGADTVNESSFLSKLDSFLFDGPFPWQVPLGLISIASIFLLVSYKYAR